MVKLVVVKSSLESKNRKSGVINSKAKRTIRINEQTNVKYAKMRHIPSSKEPFSFQFSIFDSGFFNSTIKVKEAF